MRARAATRGAGHPAPPRRRDEVRALFRNAILDAAEQVFAEQGFHGARINDIAARGRTAVGTIYNHFGQKEDVLRALLEERTEGLIQALAPAPGDPRPFAASLAARIGRMLEHIALHRGFFALAIEHGLLGNATGAARQVLGRKPLRHVDRFRTTLRDVAEQGIAAGAIRPMNPDIPARFLGAAIRAIGLHTMDDVGAHHGDDSATIVSLFLFGVH